MEDSTFTYKNIINALRNLVEWKRFCIELDISASKIKEIDVNNRGQVGDCKHDMVQFWLESDRSCSWKKLIDALISSDQLVLAEEIRSNYCPQYQDVPQTARTTPLSAAFPPSDIVADDITLNEKDVIGEGAQGCVYKAQWKGKKVAVKKIGLISNASYREIETLRSVRHKNIVMFYGVYEITPQSQRFCLILGDRKQSKSIVTDEAAISKKDPSVKTGTNLSAPEMKDLMNDVAAMIPSHWRLVGIQLDVPVNVLDDIQQQVAGVPDSNVRAFELTLSKWKSLRPHTYIWTTIVSALEAPSVGCLALAADLRNKYSY